MILKSEEPDSASVADNTAGRVLRLLRLFAAILVLHFAASPRDVGGIRPGRRMNDLPRAGGVRSANWPSRPFAFGGRPAPPSQFADSLIHSFTNLFPTFLPT